MNKQELMNLKPDKKISHYNFSLKAILGKGSYGTVYLGRNIINQTPVALKVIDNSKCYNSPIQFNSLSKEIEIMKKLKHPNIVQFYESYCSQNNIYLITEYCNGPDLRQYLTEKQIIPEVEAIKMIKQIACGLKEIVTNNFIHRDLKPANILLHDEQCKIADFGFSRPLPQDTIMESLVGTPLYMAPQILTKQQYTSKCDVWSLGLIYYEMLFGTLPFMASNYMELIFKITNTKITFPKNKPISDFSKNFILGCLQKEEIKRFSWNQVFLHPLIKPQITIMIDPGVQEVFSPKFATHRVINTDKPTLPTLRERSCSGKNLQQKIIDQKIETKPDAPSTSSQQSTECEDNTKQVKHYYYLNQLNQVEKKKRTKSNFDGKHNQTDLNLKKQIPQPLPSNGTGNAIKLNIVLKKQTILDKSPQNLPVKIKQGDVNSLIITLIMALEKENLMKENKTFESFIQKEFKAAKSGNTNFAERAQIATQFLNQLSESGNKKLEKLIRIFNLESQQYKQSKEC